MSATLGVFLKELEPTWNIILLERLDKAAQESTNPWNNAGTGHSALCELNYAPAGPDGTVSTAKALNINEQFQISRQFWASLVEEKILDNTEFINPVPHMSLVFGEDHSKYLAARFDAFRKEKLFERMEFSTEREKIAEWAPLTVNGRKGNEPIAATWAPEGTDVDFGALTQQMIDHLQPRGVEVRYGYQVTNLNRESNGLDTRYVDGKRALMFGPYAGFKTNFLKQGSLLDLPLSLRLNNIYPMSRAGLDNLDLVKYLVSELLKNKEARLESLYQYYPEADGGEWELIEAGQRVQIMKKDAKKGGILQFGTEVVSAADGSIAALLGASPGASTAAPIMLNLLSKCFPSKIAGWEPRLKELIPGYGVKLNDNPQLADELMGHTAKVLGIHN